MKSELVVPTARANTINTAAGPCIVIDEAQALRIRARLQPFPINLVGLSCRPSGTGKTQSIRSNSNE